MVFCFFLLLLLRLLRLDEVTRRRATRDHGEGFMLEAIIWSGKQNSSGTRGEKDLVVVIPRLVMCVLNRFLVPRSIVGVISRGQSHPT